MSESPPFYDDNRIHRCLEDILKWSEFANQAHNMKCDVPLAAAILLWLGAWIGCLRIIMQFCAFGRVESEWSMQERLSNDTEDSN